MSEENKLSHDTHPNPAKLWQNARRMAWICLAGAMVYPVLVYFSDSSHLVDMALPYYLFCGGVVGAYVGFSPDGTQWRGSR